MIKSASMLAFLGMLVVSACAVDSPDSESDVVQLSDVRISARDGGFVVTGSQDDTQTSVVVDELVIDGVTVSPENLSAFLPTTSNVCINCIPTNRGTVCKKEIGCPD